MKFTIPIKTTNPLNGQTGNSRLAAIIRTRARERQRTVTRLLAGTMLRDFPSPWDVLLTRIAPSSGVDDDALPATMKSIRDGLADALGVPDDRDPRFTWRYAQRRGKPKEYAVEVEIRRILLPGDKSCDIT